MNNDSKQDKLNQLEELLVSLRRSMFSGNAKHRHLVPTSVMSVVRVLSDYYNENDKYISVSELASRTGLSSSAICQHLNIIEDKMGIVKRRLSRNDKRVTEVVPTKRGRIMFAHIARHRNHSLVLNDLISYLGPKDSDELLRLLKRVNEFNLAREKKK